MKVSIIITNYEKFKWLGRAVRSALAQNFPREEFEVIVIDDGSQNGSRAMLESLGEGDNLRLIFCNENMGLPAALNKAIAQAYGMLLIRLDADDIMMRDAIFILSKFLDYNKEYGYVWADYYLVDENEQYSEAERRNEKLGCNVMFRKSVLEQVGCYDAEFRVMEEKELMVRLDKAGVKGLHIPIPLYKYREVKDSLSKSKEAAEYIQKINEKHYYEKKPRKPDPKIFEEDSDE